MSKQKQFIILHVCNHDYENDSEYIGPFYTRKEAAHYLADPKNQVVEYLSPDEHSRVPYVQTRPVEGQHPWENTTKNQLVQIANRRKEGFTYSSWGDFIKIVELRK